MEPTKPASAVLRALEIQRRKIERRKTKLIQRYEEALASVNAELAELDRENTATLERLMQKLSRID